jgi:hypothetical protein
MELIQIIESTVFIFTLGLLVLLTLSYFLFKVKNRSVNFQLYNPDKSNDVKIIYEKPPEKELRNDDPKKKTAERYIVVNETLKESPAENRKNHRKEVNPRFYIYNPGRNKIITGLQLSRIKD